MPIRLTLLITDLHLGGSPRMLRDLALGLSALTKDSGRSTKDFEITVISLKPLPEKLETRNSKLETPPTIPDQLRAAGIPVHSLDLHSLFQLPRAIPRLAKLLNTLQPDILYSLLIHANTLASLTLPFLHRKPKLIHSIHTLQEKPAWHWTLQGIISPTADALIVPSQPILERISKFGNYKRGEVIPNGIDIDRFAHAQPLPASELPWPEGAPVVGYIGRFDPVKNLPRLLRAFAKLHQQLGSFSAAPGMSALHLAPHLALVGYGPQESALHALSTSLHIAPWVHFLGPTTTPERWYKSFTLHCLPSTVEGFGLTLLESIAAGTLVVAFDTPATRTLVRVPQDGLLLPENSSEYRLAFAIKQVMEELSAAPLSPTRPSPATLSYLQSTFSTHHMVQLHAKFFKIFLSSPG